MMWPEPVWQMSIASQLPPIPLAQASAMLRAMAQNAGQTVEARVLGPLPGGLTQVQVGRQVMSLQLPTQQPVGATLTLAVQQAEGQVRVALVSAQPPAASSGSAPAPQLSTTMPATSVQLSAAALSGQGAPPASPPAANGAVALPAAQPLPQAVQGMPVANGPVAAAQPNITPAVAAPPAAVNSAVPPAAAERALPVVNPGIAVAGVQAAGARPAIPYAVAAPLVAPGPAAPMPGSATNALPPVSQSTIAGNVGQHAPPPGTQMPPPGPAGPVQPNAPAAPQPPANPQAALTQMVQQALVRQDSVLGLTAALTNIVGRVALPEPVIKAAQQVLGQRLSLDGGGPDGAALQRAVKNSGIFQEAMLAGGQARAAGGDMKSALLGLQRQLGAWLGDQPGVEQVRAIPPPLRGVLPRARAENAPPGTLPDDPELAGKVLLERTEAALSRLRLHQNASLPEPTSRHEAQWSLDLPVVLNGQQSLLHMQIHRDRDGDDPEQAEDRGWQVRFAINLSGMGEVGAQVSLRGAATGVLLWAEHEAVAAALRAGADDLRQELEALSLMPGAIVVRTGAPNAPAHPAAASGNIVDAVR